MAKGIRVCKICGKEYEYCNTVTNDRFRWQDVACCQEHATEYFALVAAARAGEQAPVKVDNEQNVASEEVVVPDAERNDVEEEDTSSKRGRLSKWKR